MAQITLRRVWREYREIRNLKASTETDYENKLQRCVGDWMPMPVTDITRERVERRHRELSRHGPRQANYVMRIVRALLNFASYKYETPAGDPLIRNNPVKSLSALRMWNQEPPRSGFIPKHKMPDWWSAVLTRRDTTRDYLITLALTGFRSCEALSLPWEQVDLDRGYIMLRDTKNRQDHILPMSDLLWSLMLERPRLGEYVFSGCGEGGTITRPYKACESISTAINHRFRPHDLRRTFHYVADLAGVPETTRKRLLNHKFQDVTNRHYGVFDPEDLRAPMQAITDKYLELALLRDC